MTTQSFSRAIVVTLLVVVPASSGLAEEAQPHLQDEDEDPGPQREVPHEASVPLELPERARVLMPMCDELPFEPEGVMAVLRVELRGLGIELSGAPGQEPLEAGEPEGVIMFDVPRCSGESSHVMLRVEHSITGATVDRSIEIAQSSEADRERIIALAATELLRRWWPELTHDTDEDEERPSLPLWLDQDPLHSPYSAAEPTEGDGLSARERRAIFQLLEDLDVAEDRRPRPVLGLLIRWDLDLRSFVSYRTGLIGGRMEVNLPLYHSPIRIGFHLGGLWGRGLDPLGYIDFALFLGGVSFVAVHQRETFSASFGPVLDVGWCGADGYPFLYSEAQWRSISSVVMLTTLRAAFSFALSRRVWMTATTDIGYVAAGIEAGADGRPSAGVAGTVIAFSLGVSINPNRVLYRRPPE